MGERPDSEDRSTQQCFTVPDLYLPQGFSAAPESSLTPRGSEQNQDDGGDSAQTDIIKSSLKLQGGDIHRDIFKIKTQANPLRRAATFSHQLPQVACGPGHDTYEPAARRRRFSGTMVIAKGFTNFLDLYGSFAGEDLNDGDASEDNTAVGADQPDEHQPLIRRPLSGPRLLSRRLSKEGDASTTKTFFTLIKAFIGTGIMFLPKAFRNGGILFSTLTLVSVSIINCLCFRLLLDCRNKYGGGYGELGATIIGPRFRSLILTSIALSQLGFVCTGLIFTAENLRAFIAAVFRGQISLDVDEYSLIACQLLPLVPLALIRNISKLGLVALIADVFILSGLLYIWSFDIQTLAKEGINPTVRLFNPSAFTLTIGSAIFTFEGIGLILPIQSSMRSPHQFWWLLCIVMLLITIVFTTIGALCYATFGEGTKIQIISNFPQDSAFVNAVQLLYSLAVLAGEPVQLFPAVRIIETSLLGERATGKRSIAVKWRKNAIRAAVMVLCVGISIVGASDLDKFVALIGSFACVPLVYIYPAYLHLQGVARSTWVRFVDMFLIILGLVAMVYTTMVTASQWAGE